MLQEIVKELEDKGCKSYFVGGFVRDNILKLKNKDIDIEVFNINYESLNSILSKYGKTSLVGKQFGIIKLVTEDGTDYDFSLPRLENKVGVGHKGFEVFINSNLSIKEAQRRRDFTINSLSQNTITKEVIDNFNGLNHIENRILHYVDSDTFVDDSLRVLRGFQFAGRFELTPTQELIDLCFSMFEEYIQLPKERILDEWFKWATKSTKPSLGLQFLKDTDWIKWYPELSSLINLQQEPAHHPEGDVWEHTLQSVDVCAKLTKDFSSDDKFICMIGTLCHDLGKKDTTKLIDGKVTSYGHDQSGEKFTRTFLSRINCPNKFIESIVSLVKEHMVHVHYKDAPNKRSVRKLIVRLGDKSLMRLLSVVVESDHSGRGSMPKGIPITFQKMIEVSNELESEIKPILMGKHLIQLGLLPSTQFGVILRKCFESQLDGLFETEEDGIEYLKTII